MNMNVFTLAIHAISGQLTNFKRLVIAAAAGLLLLSPSVHAQVLMSSTSSYTQNFNTLILTGSATWTDNSTIANWYSQRTGNGTTYAADIGTNTAGGLYSYGAASSSERALGTLGSSNAAAGNFAHGVLLRNTSTSAITDIRVTYSLEQWRNGNNTTPQPVTFWYKISASPITALNPASNGTWTQVAGLTLNSVVNTATAGALNGNTNFVTATNVSIPSLSVPVNSYIMLKWEDPDHTGNDHGLAIDDVTINWTAVSCTPPSISAKSNSGPVCDTTSLQLDVTAAGTATLAYSWTGPSGFTSTAEDPLVATPHQGYYVVTVTNGCGTAKDSTLANVAASQSWYADGDADGYGSGTAVIACSQPAGFVNVTGDCNNSNAAVHPNAAEICNGIDDDCDTFIDDADPSITGQQTFYADTDGDGYGAGSPVLACVQPPNTSTNNTDCNDNNPFISPGELEDACGNNTDDDCDGDIDEGCGTYTYYLDNDSDGFGTVDSFIVVFVSTPPAGYSANDDDCNDNNAAVNPAAQEICNSIDDDCDTFIDNADPSVTGQSTYYADADGDTYGAGSALLSCTQPPNTSVNNLDCNDGNAAVSPAAQEICNSIDDDCDTFIDNADPSVTGQTSYYTDADGDGFGTGSVILSCTAPANTATNNTDCNDAVAAIHPGATETCNGIDDDCDTFIDDADSSVTGTGTYYTDADGDGFGTGAPIHACVQPNGTAANNTDCNDAAATAHPGATEIAGNGIDDDCDGLTDELNVGDVMIIGSRFDDVDAIAFVTWINLPSGTVLKFTDNAYNGTALLSNEQTVTWTATSFIPAGTVITGTATSPSETFDLGSATGTLNGLSTSGDNIFVYQGTAASPSFIFGYNNDGTTWQTTGTVTTNSSYLPAVLNAANGNFAINEVDNAQYAAARTGLTTAQYKALILNAANWQTDDAGTVITTLNSTDFFDVNYLSTGTISSPICITATDATPVSIPYTATITFAAGNVFTAQLSNAAGSFASPVVLGTLAATASGVINGFIPSSVAAGTGYRIRVTASSPNGPGTDNGSNIIINKITATASNNGPICAGQQLNLFASGGSGYAWSGPNGFASAAQNPVIPVALTPDSGSFSVIVTDVNGCSDTVTTVAAVQDCGCFPPTLSAAVNNISCFGFNDGSVDLTVTGIATPPYTYTWSNGAVTEDLSSLPAGIYTVTVTDSTGCSASLTITITEPALFHASATSQNPVCYGAATGSINATVTGGVTPYIYNWSNGAATEDLNNITAGTYSLTATDAHGCIANTSAQIVNPPQVIVSLDGAFTLSCDSNSLGTINISASNDTLTNPNNPGLLISEFLANPSGSDSPFEWVELVATKKINFNLTPYSVIVANNGNVSTKGWVEGSSISSPNSTYAFEISTGIVNPGDVVYVGGTSMAPTGVKLRAINTGTTPGDGGIGSANSTGVIGNGGANADGIALFNHAVAAIDSNTVPVDAIFYGTAIGGSAFSGVEAGSKGFTLPVNDRYNGGHLDSASFHAVDPGANFIRATGAYNASSGIYTTPRTWAAFPAFTNQVTAITVTSVNTYQWSNGSTEQDLTNVLPGNYTVTVTTQQGCAITNTFTLATPVRPLPLVTPGDSVICNGQEIFLKVIDQGAFTGGYPQGTTVEWLDIVSGLTPHDSISSINGLYFIAQVSVPGGCVGTSDTVTVITRSVGVTPSITNETCGNGNGKIVINISGAYAPYHYIWSDGMNTLRDTVTNAAVDSIYNLSAGNYQVIVYDNEGGVVADVSSCNSGIIPFTVMSQSGPAASIASYTNILCNASADGSALAGVTGGTAPYSYLWSNGETDAAIDSLSGGIYIVTITDVNGCSDTASVNIIDPAPVQITVTPTDVSICGGNDGSALAQVTGGTPGYTYGWYDENTAPIGTVTDNPSISGLSAGLYYVQVYDTNGCNNFISFNINENCNNTTLQLKVYMEGYASSFGAPTLPMSAALYWQGITLDDTQCDTIRVDLRDQNSSSTVVETAYAVMDVNGDATLTFSAAAAGNTYWIAVMHRSSVETFSAVPVTLGSTNSYNFTEPSMAYGDNVKDLFGDGLTWALYSGDIFDSNNFDAGQDGFIDIFDYLLLDADIQAGQSGYYSTDLNGDGFVDVFDYLLLDPNIQSGISKITPP
jgi:hypothetical protein